MSKHEEEMVPETRESQGSPKIFAVEDPVEKSGENSHVYISHAPKNSQESNPASFQVHETSFATQLDDVAEYRESAQLDESVNEESNMERIDSYGPLKTNDLDDLDTDRNI